MSVRTLVTGATGYIGAFLVPRLAAEGHSIKAFSRSPIAIVNDLERDIEVVVGDLMDTEALARDMRGVQVVYHLAGLGSPTTLGAENAEIIQTNVACTESVLRAASMAGVDRVVFTSSAAVYGNVQQDPKDEELSVSPTSTYAVSKVAAEHLCLMHHQREAFDAVILRIFNVYGPFQEGYGHADKFIPQLMRSLREGSVLTLRGEGMQTRDFIHVDDVVEGLIRSAESTTAPGQPINLGTGSGITIRSVIDHLATVMGVTPQTISEPLLSSEVMCATADSTLLDNLLERWDFVDFATGLKQVVDSRADSEIGRWWRRLDQ